MRNHKLSAIDFWAPVRKVIAHLYVQEVDGKSHWAGANVVYTCPGVRGSVRRRLTLDELPSVYPWKGGRSKPKLSILGILRRLDGELLKKNPPKAK